jgi:hypothetical protein
MGVAVAGRKVGSEAVSGVGESGAKVRQEVNNAKSRMQVSPKRFDFTPFRSARLLKE